MHLTSANFMQWLRETRAVAVVELAVSLPIILFMGLAGFELSNYVITSMRVDQIASDVADRASRATADRGLPSAIIFESDINKVLDAGIQSGESFNLRSHGRIVLTSLQKEANMNWYNWQRCSGNKSVASEYGPEGSPDHSVPPMGSGAKKIEAIQDVPVMFVEVYFDYQPIVFPAFIGTRTMKSDAAFLVRDERSAAYPQNPNGAPVRACP